MTSPARLFTARADIRGKAAYLECHGPGQRASESGSVCPGTLRARVCTLVL